MRAGMRALVVGTIFGVALGGAGTKMAQAYYSSTWYEDAAGYEQAVREQRAHHAPIQAALTVAARRSLSVAFKMDADIAPRRSARAHRWRADPIRRVVLTGVPAGVPAPVSDCRCPRSPAGYRC